MFLNIFPQRLYNVHNAGTTSYGRYSEVLTIMIQYTKEKFKK